MCLCEPAFQSLWSSICDACTPGRSGPHCDDESCALVAAALIRWPPRVLSVLALIGSFYQVCVIQSSIEPVKGKALKQFMIYTNFACSMLRVIVPNNAQSPAERQRIGTCGHIAVLSLTQKLELLGVCTVFGSWLELIQSSENARKFDNDRLLKGVNLATFLFMLSLGPYL
jgi:hypothetical protein